MLSFILFARCAEVPPSLLTFSMLLRHVARCFNEGDEFYRSVRAFGFVVRVGAYHHQACSCCRHSLFSLYDILTVSFGLFPLGPTGPPQGAFLRVGFTLRRASSWPHRQHPWPEQNEPRFPLDAGKLHHGHIVGSDGVVVGGVLDRCPELCSRTTTCPQCASDMGVKHIRQGACKNNFFHRHLLQSHSSFRQELFSRCWLRITPFAPALEPQNCCDGEHNRAFLKGCANASRSVDAVPVSSRVRVGLTGFRHVQGQSRNKPRKKLDNTGAQNPSSLVVSSPLFFSQHPRSRKGGRTPLTIHTSVVSCHLCVHSAARQFEVPVLGWEVVSGCCSGFLLIPCHRTTVPTNDF